MNPPRIYIQGAGAIGLSFAYFLRQAGMNVTLILRDEKKLALFQQQNGFYYQINNKTELIPCEAQLAKQLSTTMDYLIVCTKAFDVVSAMKELQHAFSHSTQLLICHNGLGIAEVMNHSYRDLPISYGLTTLGAVRQNHFHVVMNGLGKIMLSNASFLDLFKTTKLAVSVENDFKKASWHKFIVNCAINALTVIYQSKNGELIQSDHLKYIMSEVVREIVAIAEYQNIKIDGAEMRKQVFSVANHTATNYSSMLQDINRKQLTEIDYLNGQVVLLAQQFKKKVPFNLLLTHIIKRLQHDYA